MAKAAKKPRTKTEIFNGIAEEVGISKKEVAAVFDALSSMIGGELGKGKKTEEKVFTIPGLCKIKTKYKPAQKGGQKRLNPFTGEEILTKPKPASQQVKVTPLKGLKDMVN